MQNTRTKAHSVNDKKLLNSLVKEPTWSLVICTVLLVISLITTAILALIYFGSEEPLLIYLELTIYGIVEFLVYLIILIMLLRVRYKDSLLKNEKILHVGEAPIWPVVVCSIYIALYVFAFILYLILFMLPIEDLLLTLSESPSLEPIRATVESLATMPVLWLVRNVIVILLTIVTFVMIAVLSLRPKLFLTSKRIIGHSRRRWYRFPMYSSIPYSSITSVHVTCWHHLCIGTPSGDYHFYFVKNAVSIYKELMNMITEEKAEGAEADDCYDDYDYDYSYAQSYYAPSYPQNHSYGAPAYHHAPAAPSAPQAAPRTQADFSGYKNGKPVVPKQPPKPRVPKY